MDLYYAMTNYHVLCCILHRLILNQTNKAKLWVSSYLVEDKPDIIDCLKQSNFFDEVAEFKEVKLIHYGKDDFDEKMVDEEVNNICEVVEKRYGKEIKGGLNIYVCQDSYGMGIYLNKKKLKYNFFEDGCGRLSNPETNLLLIKRDYPIREQIVKDLRLLGESVNVVKRFGDLGEQSNGYYNAKDVDFSVKRILKKLDERDLDKILKIYHCKRYNLGEKKKDLLLTWHYNNMGFMTLEEQRTFFAFLIDYFKDDEETLFIKPHPSDKQPNYQEWFKDAIVLDRALPSELLPFLVDGKFEKGITNWSTSVLGLQGILKKIVNFDKDIDSTYQDFNRYFAIVKCLDSLKSEQKIQKLELIGINKKQLLQLMKYYLKNYERYYQIVEGGGSICIVDKYKTDYSNKKCIALEKDNAYMFSRLLEINFNNKREFIYLYNVICNDFHFQKKMKYSGYDLFIESYEAVDYIDRLKSELVGRNEEIVVLKRMKKTEIERLDDIIKSYRERVNVLENEIKDLRNSSSWKMTEPLRKFSSIREKYGKRKD